MKSDAKIYARALYEATHGLSGRELAAALERFVKLLGRHQMLKKAERITAEFVAYAKKAEGIREMKIESARPLSESIVSRIKSAFGDKVEAEEKVNPGLLGGVVVQVGDTVFDASLRRQLSILKSLLSSSS